MKQYTVIKVDNHPPFSQVVTIKDALGETRVVTLGHSIPTIPVGTKFKVYETANKEPFPLDVAHSYRINNKRFVNIPHKPLTMYSVKKFWDDLGFLDSIRLQHDIRQDLRRQKITPALNKNTNLYLLLGDTVVVVR